MSFNDILRTIRNLFNFGTENHLKRRAEQSQDSGLAKYRKVNSSFQETVNAQFDDNTNFVVPPVPEEIDYAMAQKRNDNRKFFKTHQSSSSKIPQFVIQEFSDDDDDDDDIIIKPRFQPGQSRNGIPENTNFAIKISPCQQRRRPVLSEDNYKKTPIVYNIPIQIEKKSNPPPLLDVRTGGLLASTCVPPIYPLYNSKKILNGHTSSRNIPALLENGYTSNNNSDSIKNMCKNRVPNSLPLNLMHLQDRENYLELLSKRVPSLYKSPEAKENEKKKLFQQKQNVVDQIDLTDNRQISKVDELVDLTDDNEDHFIEFIDLSSDDTQETSNNLKKDDKRKSQNGSKRELIHVEPVNTLKERYDLQPKLQSKWLDNFKEKYQERNSHWKSQILEEEENVRNLGKETAKQERLLREQLKNVSLITKPDLIVLDISDSEEEVEFPEFTQEDINLLKTAIYQGPQDEVLISKFNMNITRRDVGTLVGDSWLNDEVINFYMNLLMERGEKRYNDGYPRVYAMNTFFIPRIMQSGYSGVRRWTRKVNIFEYDIIPVPVHVGGVHWCMAIIHLKNQTIKYYDSMGTANPRVLQVLEQYLKDEAYDKKKISFNTSNFVKESVDDVPRQMNGSDCGVFSCMFAEYITRNRDITFTQQHMGYFRQKMILEIIRGELML